MPHGFDEGKLTRNLDRLLSGWTDSGAQPCAQALVLRHGATAYHKAFGWANMEEKKPLQTDSIFRIYSMSKVFTAVAMLMLLEEGRARMHDPISCYLPAYRNPKVVSYDAAGHVSQVDAKREIVIRDLFTMASGLPYPGEDTPSERAALRVMQRCVRDAKAGKAWDTVRAMQELASVPLAFHPGEHWWYGFSIDVLGALVCVLSGQTLGEFMQARIFTPLGLTDTGFTVPEGKQHRLVTMYDVAADGALRPIPPEKDETHYYAPEPFESGGGGLVSTARDVSRLAQMLVGFGWFEGKRLLSRKSVELMRMNHLTPQQMQDYTWDTQRGYGYGLGVRTMMDPAKAGYGSVGEFAWDGMAGTWFCVDPAEDMTAVLLLQTKPGRHAEYVPLFAQTVYGAIAD